MREDHVVREQQRAAGDAGIGDVESRPMIRAGVDQDEVDHIAEPHSVGQVSKYPGQQQRARAQDPIIISRRAKEIEKHGNRRRRREHRKKPTTERAAFLQLAEGDAGVFRVGEIEEAANYGDVFETETPNSPGLTRLIEKINAERRDQITDAPWNAGLQLFSISCSAATQRSHTVGWSDDSPTRVE